jgi:hypothetical protein
VESTKKLQGISATAFLSLQAIVRHQGHFPTSITGTHAAMNTGFFIHCGTNETRQGPFIYEESGRKDVLLFLEHQERNT